MTFLYLLLLVTQSFALQYTVPGKFGGMTDFSDKGWRNLIDQLFPGVKGGRPPLIELNIAVEPTCAQEFPRCSTTYFGKYLALTKPYPAHLWVKWHQDATPFACDKPKGCIISSARSVADLTSQSKGWSVRASINGTVGTKNGSPTVNGKERALLSYRYSDAQISPKTMTSTKTLASICSQSHMCYIHTGTLMMTIRGNCTSRPLIVCDRHYFPCEEFVYPRPRVCSQWAHFAKKHCQSGFCNPEIEECALTVAVTGDNGIPISFQVFEQTPISGKGSIAKRAYVESGSPFGELPDGSSGAWMAWRP